MKRREMIEALGGLFLAQFVTGCKSNEGPSDPIVPPIVKAYTLELYYTRPVAINKHFAIAYLTIRGGDNTFTRVADGNMVYIDDQHFKLVFNGVVPNSYCLDAIDPARWDGDSGSDRVGKIFDVKVVETTVTTRLNDVRINNLPTNPSPSPKSEMAYFDLANDGSVISEGK